MKVQFSFLESRYTNARISHMNNHIDSLKKDIFKYANVYCFFDRMSLGSILIILTCLNHHLQNKIFKEIPDDF